MEMFSECQKINDLITDDRSAEARDELIKLLDYHDKNDIPYDPLVNNLIRQVGLYPYLQLETSSWQDRFVYESFKIDAGEDSSIVLHREQSSLLKRLVDGNSVAVSAPTSFGKSFVIDAYIAINKPKNVVIIVPTIALTDEVRRRLQRKFSYKYKIITTSDVEVSDRNIFIFPPERVVNYVEKIADLDILIVDEFYKAGKKFDKERSPALIDAIIKLGRRARQKYFLAPNISYINDNFFTRGMDFVRVDFNTVYLEKHNLYENIKGDENLKSEALLDILESSCGKTLIYAGTYSNIDKVSNLLVDNLAACDSKKLSDFEHWLTENYARNWQLTNLIKRGCGIHNGQLHRSLSQIQVRLFEEEDGLRNMISTSSIVEGVNTSAENVVIWKNKNGGSRLDDFTYRNIIGRSGRMFKHFVGKAYILEEPPASIEAELDLGFPEELVGRLDEDELKDELSSEQIAKIISYREEMSELLGGDVYDSMRKQNCFESSSSFVIRDIAKDISDNESSWNGLGYLNSTNVDDWDRLLYRALRVIPNAWGIEYSKFVGFVKVLSGNWKKSIPELLHDLDQYDIGVNEFFKLERLMTFKLASVLNDINVLQKRIFNDPVDISPFITKVSYAFLPPVVYQLEEYGLPRMLSKKIQRSGMFDFEREGVELHSFLEMFSILEFKDVIVNQVDFSDFDRYIFDYFCDGL